MKENEEHIVRYSIEELRALRAKGNTGTDWDFSLNMSQKEANRLAEEEGGAPFHDSAFWAKQEKVIAVVADSEIDAYFSKFGSNCQTMVQTALKEYIRTHPQA